MIKVDAKIAVLEGGCDAIHKLGNLKRYEDESIVIHGETKTHYIGNFLEGYGFIDVEYKKTDVRECTTEEKNLLMSMRMSMGGHEINTGINNEDDFMKIAPKIKSKSKSKYRKGKLVETISELENADMIYFHHKVCSKGWWSNWQYGCVMSYIKQGRIWLAVKKEEE